MKKSFFFIILFFMACNDNIRSAKDGDYYQYKPLEWEILIPEGWTIMTEVERAQMMYKSKGYYEEDELQKQYGEKKIIMGLRKPGDEATAIYAFTRSFRSGDDPPRLEDILNQQYQSYSSDFYSADTTLVLEQIKGMSFEKAVLNVKYNDKPYFSYITYSTQLKDTLSFGVSIVTKSSKDSLMLVENFYNSVAQLKSVTK